MSMACSCFPFMCSVISYLLVLYSTTKQSLCVKNALWKQQVRERAEKQEEERVARGEAPSEKGPQWRPGVAYEGKQLATSHNFHKGVDVFAEPDKVTADYTIYWRNRLEFPPSLTYVCLKGSCPAVSYDSRQDKA